MKKYIYGAGKYGKTLMSFFMKINVEIDGFVQTQVNDIRRTMDKPIIQFDELPSDDEYIFFLAIKDNKIIREIEDSIESRFSDFQSINCVKFIDENLLGKGSNINNGVDLAYDTEIFDESIAENMNFRSIKDMDNIIRKKIGIIPKDIELVVGIPRSGMLSASIIALLLNKPLIDINVLVSGRKSIVNELSERISAYSYDIKSYKKILVIDDSCYTGSSIDKAKNRLKNYENEIEIIYCCIYATEESKNYVDLYFEVVNMPRLFEWNILNHRIIEQSCLDLDGVLCEDPSEEENDDGDKYREFILNAKPLFIPTKKIGFIVTSRLEKYRTETEFWLEKNGIKYGRLFMLNLKTKEERIQQGAHSKFKSRIYSSLNSKLFIESNATQAQEIADKTNKDVYCIENNRFYHKDLGLVYYSEFQMFTKFLEKSLFDEVNNLSSIIDRIENIIQQILNWIKKHNVNVDMDRFNRSVNLLLARVNSSDEQFSAIDRIEIRVLVRHLCMECLRKLAENVTKKAWEAEQKSIYYELEAAIAENDYDYTYKDEIAYLRNKGKLQLYPYDFTDKYEEKVVDVEWDSEKELPYVMHKNMRLYYPCWDEGRIKHDYNQLVMEQDVNSPHFYFSDKVPFEEGDIFVDIGCAEGIISLDIVKKAKKIYLMECSEEWKDALESTFAPYKDKVCLVRRYAGYGNEGNTVTIDKMLEEHNNENIFLKMDVEGMELEVLMGARKTLMNNKCKISCATYHYDDSYREVDELLSAYGYETEKSNGYMLFIYGQLVMLNGGYERLKKPYFRKGIIRARKDKR